MGSGPSNPEPRVLAALSARPPLPGQPAFDHLLDDCADLVRRLFQTGHPCTLAVPGASRAGIEAALASLIEPGDRVLVGVFGHFGELLCTLASRHGADVLRVDAAWGQIVEPEAMAAAIARHRPRLVAIVHADTSTGIVQPLARIGQACAEAGSLFVVDAVLSLGGCEVAVDAWGVDVAIAGLQKCLGGPPGLAPITCSARAAQAWSARRAPVHSRYLDLADLSLAWQARRPETCSTSMLLALREALRIIHAEGLLARWQRHRRAKAALVAGVRAMRLEVFGEPTHAVPMITLVRVPAGIDEADVRQRLLVQHGIEIMAAFGPLRGQVWRIGTMGTNACLESVLATLAGLEAVLAASGLPVARGAAVDAASASWSGA